MKRLLPMKCIPALSRPSRGVFFVARAPSLLLLALTLQACPKKHDHDEPVEDAHAEHGHEEAKTGHREATEVHIDPSMLRDLRITLSPVESRTDGSGVTALGELSVDERRYVEVSSPIAARVRSIDVAPGETVERDAVLAELQGTSVGAARARLTAAIAVERAAKATAQRKRALAKDRIVPEREAQQAEAEATAASAERLAAADAVSILGSAKGRGDVVTLRAPMAGTVLDRSVQVGQLAEPERTLFRIAELSHVWLIVHVFERDAVRVRPGAKARVSLAALPGETINAEVTLVGASVDPRSRTIPVRLELPNPNGRLRPGMSATAFIPLAGDDERPILTVPVMALQQLESGWCVFLPSDAPGEFERRPVGRGRSLGNEVEIISGLKADEQVVVEGAFLLKAEAEKARGGVDPHAH